MTTLPEWLSIPATAALHKTPNSEPLPRATTALTVRPLALVGEHYLFAAPNGETRYVLKSEVERLNAADAAMRDPLLADLREGIAGSRPELAKALGWDGDAIDMSGLTALESDLVDNMVKAGRTELARTTAAGMRASK